jgi:hypothetical protein
MKVLVGKNTVNKSYKQKVIQSFSDGLSKHKDEATILDGETMPDLTDLENNHVGVYYGVCKTQRSNYDMRQQIKQVMDHYLEKRVIIETPLIDRKEINTEFRVGINGSLRQNAIWAWHKVDEDRVKKFYAKRNFGPHIELKKQRGDKILLALQNYHDLATQGVDLYDWAKMTIDQIRMYTDRQIIVRSNPHHSKQETESLYTFKNKIDTLENVEFQYSGRGKDSISFDQIFDEAWCVVCHSSGIAVDAVIRGLPVFSLSQQSMAWEVSNHDLSMIENPKSQDTSDWLKKMAMVQYSVDELASGECWAYVRPLCL